MIIYNITTKIDEAIEQKWLQWIKDIYIPQTMEYGLFYEHQMLRLFDDDPSAGGKTYILQFYAEQKTFCDIYLNEYAPAMSDLAYSKWGDQFFSFHTQLERVQ
ncbi:MAG: DUF4286 family protein [Ginsengibacter sp.]